MVKPGLLSNSCASERGGEVLDAAFKRRFFSEPRRSRFDHCGSSQGKRGGRENGAGRFSYSPLGALGGLCPRSRIGRDTAKPARSAVSPPSGKTMSGDEMVGQP